MKIEDFKKLKIGMEVKVSDKARENEGLKGFLRFYPTRTALIMNIFPDWDGVHLGENRIFKKNWYFARWEIELLSKCEGKQLELF